MQCFQMTSPKKSYKTRRGECI